MKKILPLLAVSAISSAFTIGLYELLLRPRQLPIKEIVYREGSNPLAVQTSNPTNKRPSRLLGASMLEQTASFSDAAAVARPFVVHIEASSGKGALDVLGGGASGSGVIVSADGYIITNNHVIEGSKEVKVTLNDRRTYAAKVIGTDPSTDLAVLKIKDGQLKERKLPVAEWTDSDKIQIGEWVLAVGNPFNLTSTVTAGIVSAKGRNIDILEGLYSIESFIQTDAAVNPGNSGGALVDAATGAVVGINTAIITRSGRYEGYSFAVPANLARKVMADLIEFGEVQRGFLGVTIKDVSTDIADKNGLSTLDGVYLEGVGKGSAAEEAGLQKGDVILRVGDVLVSSSPELQERIALFRPNNPVKIEYIRAGKSFETTATLKTQSANSSEKSGKILNQFADKEQVFSDLGIEVSELSAADKKRLKVDGGVLITRITENSQLSTTNMEVNFIITSVDGKKVRTLSELRNALFDATGDVTLDGFYEDYEGQYTYIFKKG